MTKKNRKIITNLSILVAALFIAGCMAGCSGSSTLVDAKNLTAADFTKSTLPVDATNVGLTLGDTATTGAIGSSAGAYSNLLTLKSTKAMSPIFKAGRIPAVARELDKIKVLTGIIRDPKKVARIIPELSAKGLVSFTTVLQQACSVSGTITVDTSATGEDPNEALNSTLTIDADNCKETGEDVFDGSLTVETNVDGVNFNETTGEPEFDETVSASVKTTANMTADGCTVTGEATVSSEFTEGASDFALEGSAEFKNWMVDCPETGANNRDVVLSDAVFEAAGTAGKSTEGDPGCPVTLFTAASWKAGDGVAGVFAASDNNIASYTALTGESCDLGTQANCSFPDVDGSEDAASYLTYFINGEGKLSYYGDSATDIYVCGPFTAPCNTTCTNGTTTVTIENAGICDASGYYNVKN